MEIDLGKEQGMKLVDRFWPFLKADYKSIEQYLEAQSRKGLHIRNVDSYGIRATYEKAEPRRIKYCLDYFHGTEEEAQAYQTMLADAGWNFVGLIDENLIFASNNGETPARIHTDSEEEYGRIRRGLWMFDLPVGIGSLILCYYIGINVPEIMSKSQWFYLICCICMIGFGLIGLYRSLLFIFRSKIAVSRGEPLKTSDYKVARFWGQLHAVLGLGMGVGFIGRLLMNLENVEGNITVARVFIFGGLIAWLIIMFGMNTITNYFKDKTGKRILTAFEIIMVVGFLGYCMMVA